MEILPDSSHVVQQKTKRISDACDNDTFINQKRHKAVETESNSGNSTVIIESEVSDQLSQYNKDNYIGNEDSDAESDDTLDVDCADEIWMVTDAKGKQTRIVIVFFTVYIYIYILLSIILSTKELIYQV